MVDNADSPRASSFVGTSLHPIGFMLKPLHGGLDIVFFFAVQEEKPYGKVIDVRYLKAEPLNLV